MQERSVPGPDRQEIIEGGRQLLKALADGQEMNLLMGGTLHKIFTQEPLTPSDRVLLMCMKKGLFDSTDPKVNPKQPGSRRIDPKVFVEKTRSAVEELTIFMAGSPSRDNEHDTM